MAENAADHRVVPFRPKMRPELRDLTPKNTKTGLVTDFTGRRGFFQSTEDKQAEETATSQAKFDNLANDPRKIVPSTNESSSSPVKTYSEREEADRRRQEEEWRERRDY